MAKGTTAVQSTKVEVVKKDPIVYSNSEMATAWANLQRNRTKGYWIDSDDNVESKYRLDLDKCPITLDFLATVAEKISNGSGDPKKYLLGEKYVLIINADGKNNAIFFDETQNDILGFSDRNLDQYNWINYCQDGLKYIATSLGNNSVLKAVIRRPTYKILYEMNVLDMIIKQFGERKHISIDMSKES